MNIKLYNNDCLKILQTIPSDSINCIITSPPYNKKGFTGIKKSSGNNHTWNCYSIDYSTYSDDLPKQDYITWQINFLKECVRIIKPDGSIFYNHKPIRSKNRIVFHPMEILGSFNLYQEIIWDRKNSPNVRSDLLLPCTERVYWICKNKPKCNKKNIEADFKSEVWRISPKVDKSHPATFPNKLAELCIKLSTDENDTVLDPFMGSGTTGVACKELGRNFIGIELDKKYFDIAKGRIECTTNGLFEVEEQK